MAKLTEEQKAANKLATKERGQAFTARRKAYTAELNAAAVAADAMPEQAAWVAARENTEAALKLRDKALADIDEQIETLQALRKEVELQHNEVLAEVRAKRDAAWTAHQEVQRMRKAEVESRYPDMVNCWYASQWQRPEGV